MPRAAAASPLAREAWRRALQQALGSVWVEDDFARLWEVLTAHASRGETPGLLDYQAWLRVRDECVPLFGEERTHSLLRPSVFCMLPKVGNTVAATDLFEALMGAAAWQQTCLHLRYHAGTGDGCLREHELQAFLTELAPTLAGLQALPDSFAAKWARMACRALCFFCCSRGSTRGSVSIRSLLASDSFSQLLSLQEASQGQSAANWFSARSALATYKLFLELDADKDGRLSAAEFRAGGGFTEVFVARLFEVHVRSSRAGARSGLMDFDAFCDFNLAWRHRQHRASLAYFFRILDVSARSSLGAEELCLFLREVQALWAEQGHPAVPVADVAAELFDMTRTTGRITLRDLVESGTGATVVGLLASVSEFGAYDLREDERAANAAAAAPQPQQQHQTDAPPVAVAL